MDMSASPDRRGVMFEMLRRQNISDMSTRRIAPKEQDARDSVERKAFLQAALRSWQAPPDMDAAESDAPDQPSVDLAAEPRGNHEFFRAVRA